MSGSKRIQIHNIATGDDVLVVQEVRVDVPPGEPHSLMGHREIPPGGTEYAYIHTGGAVLITRRNRNG
ncbi:MAG: hypothetical protein ACTHK2_09050 [Dokdonella sp.]|uniref:hypothetical protein n=1 Tax=Dokdonella sp. TaxID=2291710 RepID=UPI003F7CDE27